MRIKSVNNAYSASSEVMNLKRNIVRCHCGAYAALRPASVVHGDKANAEYLFVCSRYPDCDSYVGVHKNSLKPLGTLAGKELRGKRIEAHKVFNQLWESGIMKKWQAYKWMEAKFGLNQQQAHIAKFSEYMCDELILICDQALQNNFLRLAS
jgi:hypothetical protein